MARGNGAQGGGLGAVLEKELAEEKAENGRITRSLEAVMAERTNLEENLTRAEKALASLTDQVKQKDLAADESLRTLIGLFFGFCLLTFFVYTYFRSLQGA